jgi:hypothetical protein
MMRDEIWYREELQVMLDLVDAEIRRSTPTNVPAMTALGHMHLKALADWFAARPTLIQDAGR